MTREDYMRRALALARMAGAAGDVPVGCVVAGPDGRVLGEGRNRREEAGCALAHAELEAIAAACRSAGSWRLDRCALYVTLEPCPMCAGAILSARLPQVYFGAPEPHTGCCGSALDLFAEDFGFRPAVYGGLLESECSQLLSGFFRETRQLPYYSHFEGQEELM